MAEGSTTKRVEPPVSVTTQPFWDATREHRLLVQQCSECGRRISYPREVCPYCGSIQLCWLAASGLGTVYTFTVEHQLPSPLAGTPGPYVVALIDLDEGVRIMSNIVNGAPEEVAVGMRVQVTWEPLSDGRFLPLFEPAASGR